MSTSVQARKRRGIRDKERFGIKRHIAVKGRAFLSGLMLVFIGFVAGSAAMSLIPSGNAYEQAANNALIAMNTMAETDAVVHNAFWRALLTNAVSFALIVAPGAHFALSPLSAVFMALWALPYGCGAALLGKIEGGTLCFAVCVLLPALLLLPVMLAAWATALKGARRSLDSKGNAELLPSAFLCALWLLPVSYAQCTVFPALYSLLRGMF